ncbi:polyprenyl synthetase family protein [Piscinibacter sakaiensis]|uniref:polyprenyl synthetase family protein n=1 Tax=Piscinibacter sakaiensis TaxID=1547922 RepID=UPI003727514A
MSAGADATPWLALGEALGEAYQVADDIRDVAASPQLLGKPVGRDRALGRPNMAQELGLDGAIALFTRQIRHALDAIPACPGAADLRSLVLLEAERLLPEMEPPLEHAARVA